MSPMLSPEFAPQESKKPCATSKHRSSIKSLSGRAFSPILRSWQSLRNSASSNPALSALFLRRHSRTRSQMRPGSVVFSAGSRQSMAVHDSDTRLAAFVGHSPLEEVKEVPEAFRADPVLIVGCGIPHTKILGRSGKLRGAELAMVVVPFRAGCGVGLPDEMRSPEESFLTLKPPVGHRCSLHCPVRSRCG